MTTYMFDTKETAAMTKRFVSGNIKKPLISLFPYWLALGLIQTSVAVKYEWAAIITNILIGYLGALLATNFHRAYMQNHEVQSINPFKPRREDGRYIVAFLLVYISAFATGSLIGLISHTALGKTGAAIIILICLPIMLFIILRLSFIFPDRAINGHLKFKEAYNLSRGLVLKIIVTPLIAGWKWILVMILWTIAAQGIALLVAPDIHSIPSPEPGMPPVALDVPVPDILSPIAQVTAFVIGIPASFGIGYYLTALGVTALSNYYLWAKNNQYRG